MAFRDGDEVFLQSRSSKDLARYFAELLNALRDELAPRCVLDGEVVVPREVDGRVRLDWESLSQRIHPADSRVKLLADLEPLREGEDVVNDGEPSRWNSAADNRWIPVRPEKVAEVAYDQMEGNTVHGRRFRHAVKFRRWRPDREPSSCRFDQLDVPLNYDLYDVLER